MDPETEDAFVVRQVLIHHINRMYYAARSGVYRGLFSGPRRRAYDEGLRDGLLRAYVLLTDEEPKRALQSIEAEAEAEATR